VRQSGKPFARTNGSGRSADPVRLVPRMLPGRIDMERDPMLGL